MTLSSPSQDPIDIADSPCLSQWIEESIGETITHVTVEPLSSTDSASGVPLYRVSVQSDKGDRSFVVKVASAASDWIARATNDSTVREAQLARIGLPEKLPASINWPVLAVRPAVDDSWLILMTDLTASTDFRLVPSGDDQVDIDETTAHLVNLALLHTHFVGMPANWSDVALCSIEDWVTLLGPATVRREQGRDDPVTPHIAGGWEAFRRLAPKKLADAVSALLDDPKPLVQALTELPATLLHGDFKFGNLGLSQDDARTTVALDWSQAMWGPPALDLAWFLAVNSARLPFSKEEAIEIYRSAAGAANDELWRKCLNLSLLAGGLLRLGWAKALGASSADPEVAERESRELSWWFDAGETALDYLPLS